MTAAARQLPYGGRNPQPTPAMRKFLVHMQECHGGWLPKDPVRIRLSTVLAAARLGWVVLDRDLDGWIEAARITAKGRAAYLWGECVVFG